jgi:hypothetical protein
VILLVHYNNGYANAPPCYVCMCVAYLVIFYFNNLLVKCIGNGIFLFAYKPSHTVENITDLSSSLWSSVSPRGHVRPPWVCGDSYGSQRQVLSLQFFHLWSIFIDMPYADSTVVPLLAVLPRNSV